MLETLESFFRKFRVVWVDCDLLLAIFVLQNTANLDGNCYLCQYDPLHLQGVAS